MQAKSTNVNLFWVNGKCPAIFAFSCYRNRRTITKKKPMSKNDCWIGQNLSGMSEAKLTPEAKHVPIRLLPG